MIHKRRREDADNTVDTGKKTPSSTQQADLSWRRVVMQMFWSQKIKSKNTDTIPAKLEEVPLNACEKDTKEAENSTKIELLKGDTHNKSKVTTFMNLGAFFRNKASAVAVGNTDELSLATGSNNLNKSSIEGSVVSKLDKCSAAVPICHYCEKRVDEETRSVCYQCNKLYCVNCTTKDYSSSETRDVCWDCHA
ncbi:hypothetical protein AYI69_g5357 [Smittium culicis]|uniref:Uncharacterized protein n=1 Tax=Smittium culicis TaxID=133412 RepID=A0A1R1Y6K3_9FUNG|nr:hypothetical protein AYI69_g5357 [Smittium culicis]